jgi:Tfp pilus assembly protein PilN
MIRINLLPPEQRAATRSSTKVAVALFSAVAVNGALAALWAWTAFGDQARADAAVADAELALEGLRPRLQRLAALEAEEKEHKAREVALADIARHRIAWTNKLDQFVDVVDSGGEGQRHLVWFDDLSVTRAVDPRAKHVGELKGSGHSGSEKFAHVANFLDDVEQSGFATGFQPPAPPEGSQSVQDKELVPSEVWSFPLSMKIQPPEEPAAKKDAAAAKSATKPEEGAR